MSGFFKKFWAIWLIAFLGVEAVAALKKKPTLSQTVWDWFEIHETEVTTGRVVIGVFLLWLLLHITRIGIFG